MSILILGGRRSGKSARAQSLASRFDDVCVLVTAEAGDAEMDERILRHRADRPAHWRTVEVPRRLAERLKEQSAPGRCLVVDCLTLWQTNLLLDGDEAAWAAENAALLDCLPNLPGEILLVSNEVGWGVVPDNALARRFADEVGRLHQRLAACCDRVELVVAGLPMVVKE